MRVNGAESQTGSPGAWREGLCMGPRGPKEAECGTMRPRSSEERLNEGPRCPRAHGGPSNIFRVTHVRLWEWYREGIETYSLPLGLGQEGPIRPETRI